MDTLTEILNIITKRDSDIADDVLREKDHNQIMADAIEAALTFAYEEGVTEGMVQERTFWMGS